jgi:heat shock protein HslJ
MDGLTRVLSTPRSSRPRRTTGLCLALITVAALAGCGLMPSGPTATATPASIWAIPPELDGTSWHLVELNGAPPLAGTDITLTFSDGKAGGYAGCNTYAGPSAPNPAATPPAVVFTLTKRACAEPGVMAQEQAYVNTLASAAGRTLLDGRLEFYNAAGQAILVFEPAAAA